jgi:hypothetical protein
MLVPPTAIVKMSHMEVTAATATIISITQPMLTFPKDACKLLPACFYVIFFQNIDVLSS